MVDRKTYTPDEYQSSFIDYYGGFGGIDVKKAPPPVDADPTDTVSPDVLSPVGDDDGASIFNQMNITTGMPAFSSEDYDYNDYIKNFSETEQEKTGAGKDKSLSGFVDWAKNQIQTKPELLIGTATGVPGLGAMMAVGAAMNRKEQLKNANKIAESGGTGGAMFKFNNQTISRAPGSRIYSGTLGGMTQQQVANVEAIRRGFIPGTMQENQVADEDGGGWEQTGKGYLTSIGGAAMDAYGTVHSASGVQGGSASQATALREKLFVDAMNERGISLAGINVSSAALEMKQALDASMRGGIGTFETVRRQDGSTYNDNLGTAQDFVKNYVVGKYGSGTTQDDEGSGTAGAGTTSVAGAVRPSYASSAYRAPGSMGYEAGRTPADLARRRVEVAVGLPGNEERMAAAREEEAKKQAEAQAARDKERRQKEAEQRYREQQQQEDDDFNPADPGGFGQDTTSGFQDSYTEQEIAGAYFADGGRVGMQMGGTAPQAAPAGFVERPPSQVSEAATVADDKPMSVPEGTFVINAAAVEIAGETDIAKMLNKAYENYRVRGGKEVMGRTPSKEEIDVAVSRGEVIIPPHIAKIIGYDRLEKINNRGKKETSKRIEENGQRPVGAAGGGFLDVGKYAEGDEVLPTPKPSLVDRRRDEALADVELRADLESYIKDDKLARLGWDLYSKGEIDMTGVMLRNPNTGEDYAASSLGGIYFPKKGQEMYPGPVEVAKADTDQTVMPTLGKMQVGKDIRTDIPSIYYYAEKNPALEVRRDKDGKIINTPQEMSRAGVFITMAHELRHAALNYIHNEGKLKNVIGTPRAEERLMDYYDYHNRMTASKSDPSVPPISPLSLQAGRQEFASFDPMQRELNEYYENIAAAALKGRKVPPRAKRIKKNFFKKFVSDLFN
jgi:hypothetical protein